MRAKIFMLAGEDRFLPHLGYSQTVLTNLAVAFNHSFVMKQAVYSDPAADNLNAVREADASLFAGRDDLIQTMMNQLGCFAGMRVYDVSDSLRELSKMKNLLSPQGAVIWPLNGTETAISKAAVEACRYAGENYCKFGLIPPNEKSAVWENAATRAAMYSAQEAPLIAPLDQAVIGMLTAGGEGRILLSDVHEAQIVTRLLDWLSGTDSLGYSLYISDTGRFYAPAPGNTARPGVFSMLYATADMVKTSLKLEKEADCLKTAIDNVLSSGWRTQEMEQSEKTIPEQEVLRLIGEQIALAGELFEHLR